MILVDSSAWIDFFNARDTVESTFLDKALVSVFIRIGDIVLAEVLQGFRNDSDYRTDR
ncbi:MAG: putative nucleic acid-binding protein [Gammaproteobacteria bacterium]